MPREPGLAVEATGDGRFALSGVLDMVTNETFDDHLDAFTQGRGAVTLDLAGITFLDSTGVRAIVGLAQRLGERGLVLRGAQENVHRTLVIASIDGRRGIRIERG